MSEGWYKRFQVLLENYCLSLYTFLTWLQNEQEDVETFIRQIYLGKNEKTSIATVPTCTGKNI